MEHKVKPSYVTHTENLVSRLEDLQEEQAHLTSQLRLSLQIQEIWPEAFEYGNCRFSGIQREGVVDGKIGRHLCFTEAWFINGYQKRWLTAGELIAFKPDAYVHKEFAQPTEALVRL